MNFGFQGRGAVLQVISKGLAAQTSVANDARCPISFHQARQIIQMFLENKNSGEVFNSSDGKIRYNFLLLNGYKKNVCQIHIFFKTRTLVK